MAYSEALFTALAAWALHACLCRRWLLAGLLAALAGLTRPVGAAVVAAVLVTALVQVVRERGTRVRRSGALLAPLGLLGYVGWVGLRVGDRRGTSGSPGAGATASTADVRSRRGPLA